MISPINQRISFGAEAPQALQVSGGQSPLVKSATNIASGAAIGAAMGGVGCILPVSKNAVASSLSEALMVYGKETVPAARELSELIPQYNTSVNNNLWLGFIKKVKEMSDELFSQNANGMAAELGLTSKKPLISSKAAEEVFSKTQIIEAAKGKLIGKNPAVVAEDTLNKMQEQLGKKSSELLEHAKKMVQDNPKDELVQISKKIAKKARNSQLIKSTIRFGIIAAVVFGLLDTIKSAKSNKAQ